MAAVNIDPMEQPRMYQQTLLQDGLCDLLENDKFVDCVLKIKDKEFPCHRLVLAASSPFFKAMLLSDMEESKKHQIVLKDVDPGVMGVILRYLYTSDITLTEQNVQDIFIVANMYQIPSIFSVCVSYLQEKLVLGNCLAIFRLGLLLDCPSLTLGARDFICERFQVVIRDPDFHQLSPSELAIIITSDALNIKREELVFEALMDWVKHDETSRTKDLPELLHCIRFRLMPVDYFNENVESHKYIRFSQEVKKELDLVRDAQKGRFPKPKRQDRVGSKGREGSENDEERDEEEGYLPGILNNNLRFGMFEMDLILMISDTGTVAYDPVGNECFVVSESTEIPKNHCSLVTKENQVFVVGGLLYNKDDQDEPFSSYFLQVDHHLLFKTGLGHNYPKETYINTTVHKCLNFFFHGPVNKTKTNEKHRSETDNKSNGKFVMHSFCAAWNQLSHGLVRVRDPGLRDHNLTLIHYGGLKSIQS